MNFALSACNIVNQSGMKIGICNVQRVLKYTPTLNRRKLLRTLLLKKPNKNKKIQNWAKKW